MLLVHGSELVNFLLKLWHICLQSILDFLVLARSEFGLLVNRFFKCCKFLVDQLRKSGFLLLPLRFFFCEEFISFCREHEEFFLTDLIQLDLECLILVNLLIENIELVLDVVKLSLKDALGLKYSVIYRQNPVTHQRNGTAINVLSVG